MAEERASSFFSLAAVTARHDGERTRFDSESTVGSVENPCCEGWTGGEGVDKVGSTPCPTAMIISPVWENDTTAIINYRERNSTTRSMWFLSKVGIQK